MNRLARTYLDQYCYRGSSDVSKFNKIIDSLNNIVDSLDNKKPCPNNNDKLVDSFAKIFEKLNKVISDIDKCKNSFKETNENKKMIDNLTKMMDQLDKIVKEISCCEKNSKELENLKDKLTNKNKEINDALKDLETKGEQKVKQQLDDLKKKQKEDLDSAIKDLEEKQKEDNSNLKDLLNKFNDEKWIIGEYKWMPVDSKMPEGWVKVDIAQGYTLVQGSEDGKTSGKVKSHNHNFIGNSGVWSVYKIVYGNGLTNGAKDCIFPYINNLNQALVAYSTAESGSNLDKNQTDNLASGIFAELWQYQGKEKNNFNKISVMGMI